MVNRGRDKIKHSKIKNQKSQEFQNKPLPTHSVSAFKQGSVR